MSADYKTVENNCVDKKFWSIFGDLLQEYRNYQDPDGHQSDAELLGDLVGTILFHHTEGVLFDDYEALGKFINQAQSNITSWQKYYPPGYDYTERFAKSIQVRGMINMGILGEELCPVGNEHGSVIYTHWPVLKPDDPRLLEWMRESYEQHHEVRIYA